METMELDIEALQMLDAELEPQMLCWETCGMSCMDSSTYITCGYTGTWT